ncbi:MAG: adenosylcobinamide-GDP ribazoletransferase [Anaerolineaceae bacterium]|nr:adenosylcobinamide-GDP ribazoletransferase [Anaerolineaceae bacterium]MCB9101899.1 adenosylcobinamide-GDP ribazoletransferase [Anaerolineales bacterium]
MKDFLHHLSIDFASAWRLLTAIPLPFLPEDYERLSGKSTAFYPLVGLIIGVILSSVDLVFGWWLSDGLAMALLLAVWVSLTGMLHLDGFMDACDGLLPPRDRARRLEIMKDSRVGAFAVVGVVLLLLIKFNALTAVPDLRRWATLLTAPTLARWAMTWSMARYPLARKEGLSVFFGQGLGWPQVVTASGVAVLTALLLWSWTGLVLLAVTWLATTLVARLAVARIGGLTGDIYGAICEVVEIALLITIAIATSLTG